MKKKIRVALKSFVLLLFVAGLAVSISGCGSKKDRNTAVTGPGYPGYPGIPPNGIPPQGGGLLTNAIGDDGTFGMQPQVLLEMGIYTQGQMAPGYPYNGPISGQGSIHFIFMPSCPILPPGRYPIVSVQPGMMPTYLSIQNMVMTIQGTPFQVDVTGRIADNIPTQYNGMQYNSRLDVTVTILNQGMPVCSFNIN